MQKDARKKSSDPIQEHLREHKSQWNSKVSEFIDNLINFKKLINGSPSKFSMDKSKITIPIPKDPIHIISDLANSFHEIASESNDIVAEQLAYIESRKKTQNFSQRLAQAEECSNLVSEGSNALTRFLSRMKRPWFGGDDARDKRYRLSLLDYTIKIEKQYSLLQANIVGSDEASIFKATQIFFKIIDDIELVLAQLQTVQGFPEALKDDPKILAMFDKIQKYITDFDNHQKTFSEIDPVLSDKMIGLVEQFNSAKEKKVVNNDLFDEIVKTYAKIVIDIGQKLRLPGKSLSEIHRNLSDKIKQDKMQVVAHNFMSKLIGRTKHKLWSDKTTAIRIDIYNIAEECVNKTQEILDSLEEELNIKFVYDNYIYLKKLNENIKTILIPLMKSIKGLKATDSYMDLLSEKLYDYDPNLTDKQKHQLKQRLEHEQLRRLMEQYNKGFAKGRK